MESVVSVFKSFFELASDYTFCFILFTFRFQQAIADILSRIVEGNILGQGFKAIPPSQQIGTSLGTEDKLAIAAENYTPEQNQKAITLPPELTNVPLAAEAVEYVRNNPADTVIEYKNLLFNYHSERLFTRIYGTQVSLLELLLSKPEVSFSLAHLTQFHHDHQLKVGRTDYQLRDYIKFLVEFGVLSSSGSENALEYKITDDGINFLSYIKANYPQDWNKRVF